MKKILIAYDTPDWCNQEVAEQIIKNLPEGYKGQMVWGQNVFPALVEQYDMIHFLFWHDYLTYKQRHGQPPRPCLVQIHHWMHETDEWDFFRITLSGATLLGVSNIHWQNLLKNEGIMTEYMPLGVDTNHFKPGNKQPSDQAKPRVGWLGRPSPRKNLELLQESVPRAGHELVINDSYEHRMSREEQLKWYQNLDLYVSAASLEGGPMPVLEALSCGVPVLITNTGMWRELVKSKACIVTYTDIWAESYKLWADKLLNTRNVKWIARETAKEYDWKRIIKHYTTAYKACLSWREQP